MFNTAIRMKKFAPMIFSLICFSSFSSPSFCRPLKDPATIASCLLCALVLTKNSRTQRPLIQNQNKNSVTQPSTSLIRNPYDQASSPSKPSLVKFSASRAPILDLKNMPDSKYPIADGTLCEVDLKGCPEGTNLQVKLYRYLRSLAVDGDSEENISWLVRVPVGTFQNGCSRYALGLGNNADATNFVEKTNRLGTMIDFFDAEFWNKMSDILNRPIFIYSHTIYRDPKDLDKHNLVFRKSYGTDKVTPAQRVFIIPGHYNALLRPDEVEHFIKNLRSTKQQGAPCFGD